MKPWQLAAFAFLPGCIGSSLPKTPDAGGPTWEELITEHFVIDTDLEPTEATAIAQQLENLRKVMTETVFGGPPPTGPRVRVLALRRDEYGHFDRKNAGVFISSALFQPLLVTSPGGEWKTFDADVRKHELGHYVASLYVDSRLQPRWFAEGLADYVETIRYDETTGAVEIGHHPPDYQYLEFGKQATSDELWAWDQERPYDALSARLYQTSWAVVHYLFDQRPADLLDYQRALARGDDAHEAWRKIFPDLDGAGMEEMIRKYVHKRDYKITKANFPPTAVTPATRYLGEADVLALRATLYMALQPVSLRTPDESKKLAIQNVTASLGRSDSSFWAHQVNFFYFDSVTASADLAKRSIADQKDNWLAWLWYAEVLRRAKGPLDEQRSALSKALELAPSNRVALTQLAWVEARAGNWKQALDASSKAAHSPPVATDSLLALTAALSRTGHCADAQTIEAAVEKRLKGKVSKEVTALFTENHQACATEAAR
jgi:tetratricopeptide (TPR) repeat protein